MIFSAVRQIKWTGLLTKPLAAVALIFIAQATTADTAPPPETDQQISHTVVFWFKAQTPSTTVDEIIAQVKQFESLPMVEKVYVGKPLSSDREVVDDSFDIAFTLIFADEKSLREYEHDKTHLDVSRTMILPHVVRGVIYDIIQ